MPDIQTALKSALNKTLQEWDDDGEESPQPSPVVTTINNSVSAPSQGIPMLNHHKITNNVSRETFAYIKNNPGSTRQEIITDLEHRGFSKGSISSLLAQMRRNKMVHDTNGLWYADIDEFVPIKNINYAKKKAAVQATPKNAPKDVPKKGVTGIGALLREKLENMPMPSQDALDAAAYAMGTARVDVNKRMISLVRTKTPHDILKDMTVYQAHELYVHLKQMFGG
jgi:hypothetical protein